MQSDGFEFSCGLRFGSACLVAGFLFDLALTCCPARSARRSLLATCYLPLPPAAPAPRTAPTNAAFAKRLANITCTPDSFTIKNCESAAELLESKGLSNLLLNHGT